MFSNIKSYILKTFELRIQFVHNINSFYQTFTCLKSTIEILGKCVKYVKVNQGTPERHQWLWTYYWTLNISHLFLIFLLLFEQVYVSCVVIMKNLEVNIFCDKIKQRVNHTLADVFLDVFMRLRLRCDWDFILANTCVGNETKRVIHLNW